MDLKYLYIQLWRSGTPIYEFRYKPNEVKTQVVHPQAQNKILGFFLALYNFFKPVYVKKPKILFTTPVPAYTVKNLTFTRNREKENNTAQLMIPLFRIQFEDCLLALQ